MKNFISLLIFLTLSLAAKAEWTAIHLTQINDYVTFYNVDWATLKVSSKRRTIWMLVNNQGDNIGEIVSAKALYEFDCSEDKFRYLQATTFSESYGGGRVIEKNGAGGWQFIAPETAIKVVAEKVCARKK
jgi:hypothetical protein